MVKFKSWSVAALLVALAWSGCANARVAGVLGADDTAYVAAVEIVQNDTKAPPDFAGALHDALVGEAKFFGETGRPVILRIALDRVHFKNVAAAMLIGDNNWTEGRVAVVDQASGQQLGTFEIQVDAEKPGDLAGEIALDVVGAFDPTGAVDMAHMAGDASSAEINRAGTTAAMIANFTAETLRQAFGDAKTRAVHLARQNAEHAPSPAH
jgi:hypothetical protein